ncbi:MAG: NADP-dependent malic enzyme, partial [Rhodospirillales bacterium]|nr:NADP-dependent malic enzyme [Rhodospirillales bacterium]
AKRIEKLGLRLEQSTHFDVVNPENDPRYDDYWRGYHTIMQRRGVSPDAARTIIRTNTTVIAAMMIKRGEADAMICGMYGRYLEHLRHVLDIVGLAEGVLDASALSILVMQTGTIFICDTHVTYDPAVEELVEMTLLSAEAVRKFGETPKVALLSHSNFGSRDTPSAIKMRQAVQMLNEQAPDLEVDGEMQADVALDEELRKRIFPDSRLTGQANLLILPNLEAANNAFNFLKSLGEGLPMGPILVGCASPVHILTPSVTARGIINMAALAVVDAQTRKAD